MNIQLLIKRLLRRRLRRWIIIHLSDTHCCVRRTKETTVSPSLTLTSEAYDFSPLKSQQIFLWIYDAPLSQWRLRKQLLLLGGSNNLSRLNDYLRFIQQ